jgi:predicted metal-dependent phosphoesterase TrpH
LVLFKSDLHIHTSDDVEDSFIKYSAKDIIDEASNKGINVIAITLHNKLLDIKNLKSYARKKNVLIISGVEAKIEGKHILIYNINSKEYVKIHSFKDLRALKKRNKNIFVIAPHPFMPKSFLTKNCIHDKYFDNKDIIDALEFQMFNSFLLNPNKKTSKIANEDNKPLIANTDLHFKRFFGQNYTLVDVKGVLNEKNFFNAIKQGKTEIVSSTNFLTFLSLLFSHVFYAFKKEKFRS